MRRYGSKKAPKGASTQMFRSLSPTDQVEGVKKLRASGLPIEAIADLTGLVEGDVGRMLDTPFGLAAPKREGTTVCRYCYFTPDKCICDGEGK